MKHRAAHEVLSTAAKASNKHINLGKKPKDKFIKTDPELKLAAKIQEDAHKTGSVFQRAMNLLKMTKLKPKINLNKRVPITEN